MKKILLLKIILLYIIVSISVLGCSDGEDYVKDGLEAQKSGHLNKAIRLHTTAIGSFDLSQILLSQAHNSRGLAWFKKGYDNLAISDFSKAIEANPNFSEAYNNRGNLWAKKEDYDKALTDFTMAIKLNPNFFEAYNNRSLVWARKEEYNKSISDCTKAIELNPEDAMAYGTLGFLWKTKGDYYKAKEHLAKALELNPKDIRHYNNLAWFLATCPDPKYRNGVKAVTLAQKAQETKETPYNLDTLAAAYAEAGRFQEAIQTQTKAIGSAVLEGKTKFLTDMYKRKDLYEAGQPWREP